MKFFYFLSCSDSLRGKQKTIITFHSEIVNIFITWLNSVTIEYYPIDSVLQMSDVRLSACLSVSLRLTVIMITVELVTETPVIWRQVQSFTQTQSFLAETESPEKKI